MTQVDEAGAVQRLALHPAESVWVAASAGTGKTKVLTDRLLALMLNGTDPGHILCLTFTRAAAAEMANRINQRLADWTTLAPGRLAEELVELTPKSADLQAKVVLPPTARLMGAPPLPVNPVGHAIGLPAVLVVQQAGAT